MEIKDKVIQGLIKSGREFDVSFDDIDLSEEDFEEASTHLSFLKEYDASDLNELFEYIDDDQIKKLLDVEMIDKEEMIKSMIEYDGAEIEEVYKLIENESCIYESDFEKLSEEKLKLYKDLLDKHKDDDSSDEFKQLISKYSYDDITDYYIDILKGDIEGINELSSSDWKNLYELSFDFLEKLDVETFCTRNMSWSLSNFPKMSYSFQETKEEFCLSANEYYQDEKLTKWLVDKGYIDIEDVESEDEKEVRIIEETSSKWQNIIDRNRISIEEIIVLFERFNVQNYSLNEGHIGLEDMTFDHLRFDGKLLGDTFGDKPWINGRSFGDNRMSLTFIKEFLIDNRFIESNELDIFIENKIEG
jgi:hypothetical protein